MKKLIKIFYSMKFAILILVLMILLSVVGSLIPQNEPANFYFLNYGQKLGKLFVGLGLDDVFHSGWYIVLSILLCLSLFICVLFRIKRLKKAFQLEDKSIFFNLFGSWLLHLGIFLIILFYSLGNMTSFETTVYNIAGTRMEVPETDMEIEIDDFSIDLREDETVESYRTYVKVYDRDKGLIDQGEIKVNQPLQVNGYQFSQASFGYAANTTVYRFGQEIGQATLFQDEVVSADSGKFYIEMVTIFPDFVEDEHGYGTKSPYFNNPRVLVNVYYVDQLVGRDLLEMGQEINIGEYTAYIDQPSHYTLLAIRKDPFMGAVGIGALILLAGIGLVFFGPKTEEEREDE